ncbi:DeoR/GlpR transcriptional regulator [Acidaminobacter sp. JC074]|uniref:DeoR/GlpR family DNA-binding transcription regulator n=1 Tax=Acidaminobacter sp. JC074 TaxID=2530199 RepID=UPI001F10F1BF|nr:DeoR/GlpR family DNA-binding transcription regulator [Acidaminobacter sp. JC074]MCH4889267.1 DeoR/GlpR transcriptional regulator [Acidaminobacter sp. JC074]
MLTQERYKKIMDQLDKKQTIKVGEMAELLDVSVDTIRRDLKYLETKRLLVRTHGGAVVYDMAYENTSIPERKKRMTTSKVNLGKEIIDELKDGDVLFLDGSTTTMLMVPLLKGLKDLTIITNSMYTGIEVVENKLDAKLHILGGVVLDPIGSVVGIEALKSLSLHTIDKAILSCYSVTQEGFYDIDFDESAFKREIIEMSGAVYFLMDASKLVAEGKMFISQMNDKMTLVLEEPAFKVHKGRLLIKK